jgi:predicted XRE-type DNA-binding protein
MSTQKSDLNVTLKKAILTIGKRQRAVAAEAGIPETRLSEIVNRRMTPATDDEKKALARALHATVARLFPSSSSEAVAS